MPRLGYRKSTGNLIPDFQRDATEEGLVQNAVRAGIPAEDVEVRMLSDAEWDAAESATYDAVRQAEKSTELTRRQQAINFLKTKLRLDDTEARNVARAIYYLIND